MEETRRVRILIGKAGLDGHDRGAKIIARALRDAGFEVIYSGLHNTPDVIVSTAIEEDVDGIGISILSGAHNYIIPEVINQLKSSGANDIVVFCGGIIPDDDIEGLLQKGVRAVFTPGSSITEMVRWVRENVKPKSSI
ncbi:MAG: cobalamin B12-binding domain-containing protein [Candidatus Caldarchaeum sp.]